MFRAILYLILFTVLISALKSVWGIIGKAFGGGFTASGAAGGGGPRKAATQVVGELRKDPVCGTFVSTATPFQKTARGETQYFCSAECQAKFKG